MDATCGDPAAIPAFAPPGMPQVPAAFPAVASADERRAGWNRHAVGVLLVEDDEKLADVLIRALRGRGFEAIVAGTGSTALELMRHCPDVAAVVLDIMIPAPDGIEVCRCLRRAGWQGAIVLISALDGPETRRRSRSSGADVFLAKPFRLTELLDAVTALIGRPSPWHRGTAP
jgi:DNA-binding response OmpR family regulator